MTALKATTIGVASAAGSGGTVYGAYYLITYKEEFVYKELQTWVEENKCNIVDVEETIGSQKQKTYLKYLSKDKGAKLLEWLKQSNNKTTAGCGTPDTPVTLKTDNNWTNFTK